MVINVIEGPAWFMVAQGFIQNNVYYILQKHKVH